jgi:SsrA-binding protein
MKIINKRASRDYQLYEKIQAGISLIGGEVKSVRAKKVNISLAYAKIIGSEIFLINANIPIPGKKNYNPTRTRKLLLHKHEIISIGSKIKQKKLTLIPLSMYTKDKLIKVELALAKPKKKFEKRESLKKKDIELEIQRELKDKWSVR